MRIAHLSDLHFGRHDPAVAGGLANDISGVAPDLVVVSGDFTQIGSEAEFAAARDFLDEISAPVMAVPGNHDVPAYNLIKRFSNPYGHYRRFIAPDLEPFVEMDGVALAGLKTVRRVRMGLNWAHGSINRTQLDELAGQFAKGSPDAVKIVVAHHPLLFPEEAMQKKMRLVKRADLALQTFADLGVRLVLSGHFHMSYVRRHEHAGEVAEAMPVGPRESAAAPILVAQASSTISTRLRGHANGYNVIDINDGTIDIRVREWQGSEWRTREEIVASTTPPATVPAA